MVTIKTKKSLTFNELVQHIFNKVEKPEVFVGYDSEEEVVEVAANRYKIVDIDLECSRIDEGTRFKVEVEEKIELNTYIPIIIEVYLTPNWEHNVSSFEYASINGVRDNNTLQLYTLNEKGEMVLIWSRNGGMVE